jgi:outer membrane protein insertion porin family
MPSSPSPLLWALAVLAGVPGAVTAQQADALFGRNVVTVVFDVEGRPETSPAIASLAEIRPGQPLRRRDVSATMRHLDGLGRYDDVRVDASAVAEGVAVVVHLVPRHPVTNLEVRGDAGATLRALEAEIRQRYGGVPTDARASAVENTAARFLADEGYLDADVRADLERVHNPDAATLVLHVNAGTRAVVASAEVRGTSPLSSGDVLGRTGARPGQPFRRLAVESGLSAIEDELRGMGYYEAQATVSVERSPAGVDVAIAVNAGRQVELRIEPAGVVPGRVEDLVPIKSLGSADLDLLEDSRARIEAVLKADGYWRASAPFTRIVDAATDRLVITFAVTRGPRFYVERIEMPASLNLPTATLSKLIAIRPGDVFDGARFTRGLAAIADEYRRNGYYRMVAEPSYESIGETPDGARASVVLHPNIVEGPRAAISTVTFTVESGSPVDEATLRAVMRSRPGAPYIQADMIADRSTLERLYRDRGFRSASVEVRPTIAADERQVALDITVSPGQQIRIGQISIVGNERVSEQAIRDELGLEVGDPAGTTAIIESQQRIIGMAGFRTVTISSVDQFTDPATHLMVSVAEAAATTVAFGGGLEGGRFQRLVADGRVDDLLEFAPRGSFEISRRNLGGRNRTVSLFSRVSLKRDRRLPSEGTDPGGFGFTEYRASLTFRERHAFRTDTDLLVGLTSEQAVRTGFNFIRQGVNAELFRPLGRQLSMSLRYLLDFTKLLDQQFEGSEPDIDRAFPQVRLSTVAVGLSWDRRDRPAAPTRGFHSAMDLEGAFRGIGSEVGYAKAFVQTSGYRRLDSAGRTVLAGRVEVGLASGFARTAVITDEDGNPIGTEVIDDLPASRRFFAGGGTTVRGFQTDRLAVPELFRNGFPLGGNGLVVLNAEVRRVITQFFNRNFGAAAFIDSGNVFARANDMDLGRLRTGAGFGIRYDSPLGPLRLDFGFKLKPETVSGTRERGWEYHLSILEAF